MQEINLFNECRIESYFDSNNEKIRNLLRNNLARIKDGDPSAIAKEVANNHKINCPEFDFPSTKTSVQRLPERVRHEVVLTDFAFYEIPFTGDKEILRCIPDRANCVQPFPLPVEIGTNKIYFSLNSQGYMDNPGQPRERVKKYAESIKDFMECSIVSLQESIDIYNESLEKVIREGISDAKARMNTEEAARKEIEDDLNPFK